MKNINLLYISTIAIQLVFDLLRSPSVCFNRRELCYSNRDFCIFSIILYTTLLGMIMMQYSNLDHSMTERKRLHQTPLLFVLLIDSNSFYFLYTSFSMTFYFLRSLLITEIKTFFGSIFVTILLFVISILLFFCFCNRLIEEFSF